MTLIASRLTSTPHQITTPVTLTGEVRHPNLRYRLELKSKNDSSLHGRLGGRIFGEELRLEVNGNDLLGTVIGSNVRLAVHASLQREELHLRISGSSTATAFVHFSGDSGSGAWHSGDTVTQVNLTFSGDQLTGRLSSGATIRLESVSAPRWLTLSAALIGFIVTQVVDRTQLESLRGMDTL
ncbi:MAG: hypothetical protein HC933_22420 [Pleurocapsa sp. SU_196_0]|nr:hypothetical protein [Pleurocapsa sp. SU_196_0]